MGTFVDWSNACQTIIHGQSALLDSITCGVIETGVGRGGFHGLILEGQTGSGKTAFGRALADRCPFAKENVHFVDCITFHTDSQIGGPERRVRAALSLKGHVPTEPSLLVLDHAECLFGEKSLARDSDSLAVFTDGFMATERRLYLLARDCIDQLRNAATAVFCIAIVSDRRVFPAEIRRPGRFSQSFAVNVAMFAQRREVLTRFLRDWQFSTSTAKDECIQMLAGQPTSGFTVADMEGLLQRTIELVQRRGASLSQHRFRLEDFLEARHFVRPASVVAQAVLPRFQPRVEIVGLDAQREQLHRFVLTAFQHGSDNGHANGPPPRGILLSGPSGCGKTLLASSLARLPICMERTATVVHSPITFIAVDSTHILSKYLGQSDQNLARVFDEARQAAPCILFFDQIEQLVQRRGGDETSDRLVTTFLVEMDGLKSKTDDRAVIVVGATSRKHAIDPAMLRPGRLELHLHIPPPDRPARLAFIHALRQRTRDSDGNFSFRLNDSDIEQLLEMTEGHSMADLDALFRESALLALRQDFECERVEMRHFVEALACRRKGI